LLNRQKVNVNSLQRNLDLMIVTVQIKRIRRQIDLIEDNLALFD
jgi:hypothetical protein